MFKNGLLFGLGFFLGKFVANCVVGTIKVSVDAIKAYNDSGDVNQIKEMIIEEYGLNKHKTSDKTKRVIGF